MDTKKEEEEEPPKEDGGAKPPVEKVPSTGSLSLTFSDDEEGKEGGKPPVETKEGGKPVPKVSSSGSLALTSDDEEAKKKLESWLSGGGGGVPPASTKASTEPTTAPWTAASTTGTKAEPPSTTSTKPPAGPVGVLKKHSPKLPDEGRKAEATAPTSGPAVPAGTGTAAGHRRNVSWGADVPSLDQQAEADAATKRSPGLSPILSGYPGFGDASEDSSSARCRRPSSQGLMIDRRLRHRASIFHPTWSIHWRAKQRL